MQEIRELVGKEVEVSANGVSYQGILVEVSDSEVYLKGTMGYVTLPTSSVGDVKVAEKKSASWDATFAVPPETKKDLIP